ncbi:MAG: hypothetical protein L3J45_01880 [Flavobacteriaceae bacterium]|nr:hypothetical protein [Flavobacteriaceae bacterium]
MKKHLNSSFVFNMLLLIFSIILVFSTRNNPFYWDNIIQLSVPANWYFETNFNFFYLPDTIATGHPTFVGMYFASLWKIFGRSLMVCHLGMLPFVFGLLLQLRKFLKNINIKGNLTVLLIMLVVILDPTFLSQLSLITFDIIQLFFFFLCVNLILKNKHSAFAFCYVILMLISLRASIMAGGLLIFNILFNYYGLNKKIRAKDYLKFIPGIVSLFLFLLLFKINKGWVIHNTVSNNWGTSAKYASFYQIIRNTGVFIWRLIDFGRLGIYLFFVFFLFKTISLRKFQDKTLKTLFLIIITQFIVLFPIIVIYQNPFGHRYLLPIIIPTLVLTVYWIKNYTKFSFFGITFVFVVLLSGHFWIYPLKISQGWDATTLHWKYFTVSEKMNSFIKENNFDKKEIATFFPNKYSRYLSHIEEDKNDVYKGVVFKDGYILYSNAFNVSDKVIDTLYSKNSHWKLVKKYSEAKIFISLYKKED